MKRMIYLVILVVAGIACKNTTPESSIKAVGDGGQPTSSETEKFNFMQCPQYLTEAKTLMENSNPESYALSWNDIQCLLPYLKLDYAAAEGPIFDGVLNKNDLGLFQLAILEMAKRSRFEKEETRLPLQAGVYDRDLTQGNSCTSLEVSVRTNSATIRMEMKCADGSGAYVFENCQGPECTATDGTKITVFGTNFLLTKGEVENNYTFASELGDTRCPNAGIPLAGSCWYVSENNNNCKNKCESQQLQPAPATCNVNASLCKTLGGLFGEPSYDEQSRGNICTVFYYSGDNHRTFLQEMNADRCKTYASNYQRQVCACQ